MTVAERANPPAMVEGRPGRPPAGSDRGPSGGTATRGQPQQPQRPGGKGRGFSAPVRDRARRQGHDGVRASRCPGNGGRSARSSSCRLGQSVRRERMRSRAAAKHLPRPMRLRTSRESGRCVHGSRDTASTAVGTRRPGGPGGCHDEC